MQAAGQLAQLPERLRELAARLGDGGAGLGVVAQARLEHAQLEVQRDQALLGAVVEVALQAPPLALSGLEDARADGAQLVDAGQQLGLEPRVLDGDRGRRADGVQQLGLLAQRRVVHERGHGRAVAIDERRDAARVGRQLHRLAVEVGVGLVLGQPGREDERRVAQRAGQRVAQRARRRVGAQGEHELADGRAREARAQHVDEHGDRHRDERDDRGDREPLGRRAVGDLLDAEPGRHEQQHERAGEDRREPAAQRGAGRPEAADEDRDERERTAGQQHRAARCRWRRPRPGRPRSAARCRAARSRGRPATPAPAGSRRPRTAR